MGIGSPCAGGMTPSFFVVDAVVAVYASGTMAV
jgi:hypothetical protein